MIVKSTRAAIAAIGLVAASSAFAGAITGGAQGPPQKMPEGEHKLETRNGYWVECDGAGNCHYVYMSGEFMANGDLKPGAKFHKVKADAAKVQPKDGYWVECSYSGLGDDCHYVYMFGAQLKAK